MPYRTVATTCAKFHQTLGSGGGGTVSLSPHVPTTHLTYQNPINGAPTPVSGTAPLGPLCDSRFYPAPPAIVPQSCQDSDTDRTLQLRGRCRHCECQSADGPKLTSTPIPTTTPQQTLYTHLPRPTFSATPETTAQNSTVRQRPTADTPSRNLPRCSIFILISICRSVYYCPYVASHLLSTPGHANESRCTLHTTAKPLFDNPHTLPLTTTHDSTPSYYKPAKACFDSKVFQAASCRRWI